jgi:hypothetical protein
MPPTGASRRPFSRSCVASSSAGIDYEPCDYSAPRRRWQRRRRCGPRLKSAWRVGTRRVFESVAVRRSRSRRTASHRRRRVDHGGSGLGDHLVESGTRNAFRIRLHPRNPIAAQRCERSPRAMLPPPRQLAVADRLTNAQIRPLVASIRRVTRPARFFVPSGCRRPCAVLNRRHDAVPARLAPSSPKALLRFNNSC